MKKVIAILLILMMVSGLVIADDGHRLEDIERSFEKGLVLSIEEEESDHSFISKIQHVEVEMLTGEFKGKIVMIENVISDSYVMDIDVKVGQKVLISVEIYEDGTTEFYITSEVRDHYILYMLIGFVLVLIIVGRFQGVKTIFTLGVTFFFIVMVELPLLIKGYNAVWVTVIVAIFITIITVTVISGLTKKSLAAIIGTTFGVIIAGGLAIFVSNQVKLTGLSMDEAVMLLSIQGETINFQYLLFAAILLGALGAIMDVAMSIASSIDEVHNVNAALSFKELFDSGMRVGRDIMGTMANTLILAYTGSSLPLLLLFMSANDSLTRLVNLDIIATEVIRSLAGSIGLVLTIPVTAIISVSLIKDHRFNK